MKQSLSSFGIGAVADLVIPTGKDILNVLVTPSDAIVGMDEAGVVHNLTERWVDGTGLGVNQAISIGNNGIPVTWGPYQNITSYWLAFLNANPAFVTSLTANTVKVRITFNTTFVSGGGQAGRTNGLLQIIDSDVNGQNNMSSDGFSDAAFDSGVSFTRQDQVTNFSLKLPPGRNTLIPFQEISAYGAGSGTNNNLFLTISVDSYVPKS